MKRVSHTGTNRSFSCRTLSKPSSTWFGRIAESLRARLRGCHDLQVCPRHVRFFGMRRRKTSSDRRHSSAHPERAFRSASRRGSPRWRPSSPPPPPGGSRFCTASSPSHPDRLRSPSRRHVSARGLRDVTVAPPRPVRERARLVPSRGVRARRDTRGRAGVASRRRAPRSGRSPPARRRIRARRTRDPRPTNLESRPRRR